MHIYHNYHSLCPAFRMIKALIALCHVDIGAHDVIVGDCGKQRTVAATALKKKWMITQVTQ